MYKKYGAWSSSTDYTKLAQSVEGVFVICSSVIIFGATLFGYTILPDQIQEFAQNAGTTVGAFGTFVGAIMSLKGLIRKMFVKVVEVKPAE